MAYIGKSPSVTALTSSDIADGIISNAKLAQDIISAETELAEAPASTDEFLISDAGTLKRLDASHVGGGALVKTVTADYSTGVTNFTLTNCFTSDYAVYKVFAFNLLGASDGGELRAYFLDSGGSTVGNWQITTTGAYIQYSGNGNGESNEAQDDSDNIRFTGENLQSEANKVSSLEMTIFQPYESTQTAVHFDYWINADNDYLYKKAGSALLKSNTSVRSLKFQTSTGINFTSYKTTVFGLDRS